MTESVVDPPDEENPCLRAARLRLKRDKLITGEAVAEYDFESGNGVRRRVKYTTASLPRLDAAITEAENACLISKGKRARKFAVGPLRGRRGC